jgi:hypothetical protein
MTETVVIPTDTAHDIPQIDIIEFQANLNELESMIEQLSK